MDEPGADEPVMDEATFARVAPDKEPLFALGRCVMTPGAQMALIANQTCPTALLYKHLTGDWGEVDTEDWKANDKAVTRGERTLSAYLLPDRTTVWVITEWDRSVTTLLLPAEY